MAPGFVFDLLGFQSSWGLEITDNVCINGSSGRLTGLPDDLFSNQTLQFWYVLVGLGIKNFRIYYDHLTHFVAICFVE
jgi:hypothetical protein